MGDARDTAKKKKADEKKSTGQEAGREASREGRGQGSAEVRQEVNDPRVEPNCPGPGSRRSHESRKPGPGSPFEVHATVRSASEAGLRIVPRAARSWAARRLRRLAQGHR